MSRSRSTTYAVTVGPCPQNPDLFRWTLLKGSQSLPREGYAYATRWMAEEAGKVALECYLTAARESGAGIVADRSTGDPRQHFAA
jgi:hypothetical protein